MKKFMNNWGGYLLVILAVIVGSATGVYLATTTDMGGETAAMPEGGVTVVDATGGATATTGIETTGTDNPEFYAKEIDKRITKMRPMKTPIDQITRSATQVSKSKSMIVKYYSVSTRAIKTAVKSNVAEMSSGATSISLPVDDATLFCITDTIRVSGVKGYKADGVTADTKDLMLYVVGKSDDTGYPTVIAVNGKLNSDSSTSIVPAIDADTKIIRMGRAAAEIDVETGQFYNLPTPQEQYCQTFMMQVEQSTVDKMWSKEVDWNFSDMEEDGIYDMRLGMENSYLFGVKGKYHLYYIFLAPYQT